MWDLVCGVDGNDFFDYFNSNGFSNWYLCVVCCDCD